MLICEAVVCSLYWADIYLNEKTAAEIHICISNLYFRENCGKLSLGGLFYLNKIKVTGLMCFSGSAGSCLAVGSLR
jgi:hypothetical protein